MREIKFRAWQKYHKKMVEVTSISFDDTGEINGVTTFVENQAPQRINYKDGLLGGFFLKDERGMVLELMQYTGLNDENGVEIFEGDIVVAWSNGLEGTFVIKWRQEGSPSWILYPAWQNSEHWNLHGSLHNDAQYYDKGIEVIGNIYENPELLEVSEW